MILGITYRDWQIAVSLQDKMQPYLNLEYLEIIRLLEFIYLVSYQAGLK